MLYIKGLQAKEYCFQRLGPSQVVLCANQDSRTLATTITMESRGESVNESSDRFLKDFLSARSSTFRELAELRAMVSSDEAFRVYLPIVKLYFCTGSNILLEQGWANKDADREFEERRQRSDHADSKARRMFFNMMRGIGDELHDATGALRIQGTSPEVLDLCMAPGGYTASALKFNPHARVSGITLPEDEGGHQLLVKWGSSDSRVQVAQMDITMLWSEFCDESIPEDYPDKIKVLHGERPYLDKSFDLVFCDGQVLRTQKRSTFREGKENLRLICSQLILAMQRIRLGGTMIILLHRTDAWDTVKLLFQFNSFANIQLFKPQKKHGIKSSFYLIATHVNPTHSVAISAVKAWKEDWREATFAYRENTIGPGKTRARDNDEESHVLNEFGSTLIELGEPIWAIQRDNLRKAAFISKEKKKDSQPPVSHDACTP